MGLSIASKLDGAGLGSCGVVMGQSTGAQAARVSLNISWDFDFKLEVELALVFTPLKGSLRPILLSLALAKHTNDVDILCNIRVCMKTHDQPPLSLFHIWSWWYHGFREVPIAGFTQIRKAYMLHLRLPWQQTALVLLGLTVECELWCINREAIMEWRYMYTIVEKSLVHDIKGIYRATIGGKRACNVHRQWNLKCLLKTEFEPSHEHCFDYLSAHSLWGLAKSRGYIMALVAR